MSRHNCKNQKTQMTPTISTFFRILFFIGLLYSARASEVLVWGDEFLQTAGSTPDGSKWTQEVRAGNAGNGELQTYTLGNCVIVNDPAAIDGKALSISAYKTANGYVSGRINSLGKYTFKYGRIEARIKVPAGKGLWPAFWMLGSNISQVLWPTCGEIDIMEALGGRSGNIYGRIHGPITGSSNAYGPGAEYSSLLTNFAAGYHLYSVQWVPGKITWLVDGIAYGSVTPSDLPSQGIWCFDDRTFFIVLNVAVGGTWPGYPDATTVFPQSMLVDYVRVYAEKPNAVSIQTTLQ